MGVDNEVKLFFGIELEYEDAQKIGKAYDLNLYDMLWNEQMDGFEGEYPDLCLGYASLYYDCYLEDASIFISIGEYSDSFTISEMEELLLKYKNGDSSYSKCLERFGIDFSEPKIIALPHIC